MQRLLWSVALLFIGLTLYFNMDRSAPEVEPVLGGLAPGFELADLDGNSTTLEEFRGKIVILDFWATWCGPCRLSMPVLEELQREFPDQVVLLAINLQEPGDLVRSYAQQNRVTSRILLDLEGRVGDAYDTISIPLHVLIDQEGVIRHIQAGFRPDLSRLMRTEITRLLSS